MAAPRWDVSIGFPADAPLVVRIAARLDSDPQIGLANAPASFAGRRVQCQAPPRNRMAGKT